ncbi:hypothetical protein BGY98DRAFT_1046514, partial [Russula aff. rugulosa BPL654]
TTFAPSNCSTYHFLFPHCLPEVIYLRMAFALILRFNIKNFHQSLIGLWHCPPIFLSSSVLGPRPYITPLIVLVLSLVFVEYLPTCRSLKP